MFPGRMYGRAKWYRWCIKHLESDLKRRIVQLTMPILVASVVLVGIAARLLILVDLVNHVQRHGLRRRYQRLPW